MTRRRKHNWPQLFADFDQSGQNQAEFCKQRGINPNYFSLKLSKHKAASPPAFARVAVDPPAEQTQCLVIEIGNCKIHCPATMSTQMFAALVRALA